MDLRQDELFMALFGQVQALDAVLMAVVKTHPRPTELLAEVEQSIALVRSASATQSAMNPVGRLAHEKLVAKTDWWLAYCRDSLRRD